MNPKVSVIVPAYNTAEFIAQTLDSIENQTYSDWECIIVDDGSTDNTADIAKAYCQKDSRFQYYYQKNAGPCVARNFGILNSTGEFILPVDSDDLIAETYLEKAVNRFEAFPETALVYGLVQHFGDKNDIPEMVDFSYEYLLFVWNVFVATSMFKRKDFDRIGGYRLNMRKGLEDWDFWIALLSPESTVYKIPEIMFYYRIRGASRTETADKNIQELREKIYWNNADKYDQYLPNLAYHHFHGHDCEKILEQVPERTKNHVQFLQHHVFLRADEYTWKHAIINKIAKLFGLGLIFINQRWSS